MNKNPFTGVRRGRTQGAPSGGKGGGSKEKQTKTNSVAGKTPQNQEWVQQGDTLIAHNVYSVHAKNKSA